MTNLLVAYLILKKISIQEPHNWRKSLSDINQLGIPNTLKTKLFHGVTYNLSRKLIAERPTLDQSFYVFLKLQLDAFSDIEFEPISTI